MSPLKALLLLTLLGTCACAQKITEAPSAPPTTTGHDPAPAEISGFGPVTTTDFGARLYQPSASLSADQVLETIQRAFPEQSIYLDLWATWCKPCIGEFPDSKRLHGETQGLPVVFVYLCTATGGTPERWRSIINYGKLPGTHVYLSRSVHSAVMEKLETDYYPSYVVLSPDGDVKYDVRRPSQLNRNRMERLIR